MRGDPDNLSAMVLRVQKWLVTKRWRKAIYGAICVQKCEYFIPCAVNIILGSFIHIIPHFNVSKQSDWSIGGEY